MIYPHQWDDMPAEILIETHGTEPDRRFCDYAASILGDVPMRFWSAKFTKESTGTGGSHLEHELHKGTPSVQAALADLGPWIPGFPHIHSWTTRANCLILCVQAPLVGGALVIFDGEGERHTYPPMAGLSVMFPMGLLDAYAHGVRPVRSGTRIMQVAVTT